MTNRCSEPAIFNYAYTPHRGDKSYTATDGQGPLQQKIKSDAIGYLKGLGVPIPQTGNQIGTLRVHVTGSSEVAAVVGTTTAVPEGRAGLAYPAIPDHEGIPGRSGLSVRAVAEPAGLLPTWPSRTWEPGVRSP